MALILNCWDISQKHNLSDFLPDLDHTHTFLERTLFAITFTANTITFSKIPKDWFNRRNQIRCQFVGSINKPLIETPLKNNSCYSHTKSACSYPYNIPRFSNARIAACIQTSSLWHLKHPTKLGCVVGGPLGSRSG